MTLPLMGLPISFDDAPALGADNAVRGAGQAKSR